MKCELCHTEQDVFALLPIKQVDGALQTIACRNCGIKAGKYCTKHDIPHTGFDGDETTACLRCIEDEVRVEASQGPRYLVWLTAELPPTERDRLQEWFEMVTEITGQDEATCLMRALITKKLRTQAPDCDTIVRQVIVLRSVDAILPRAY